MLVLALLWGGALVPDWRQFDSASVLGKVKHPGADSATALPVAVSIRRSATQDDDKQLQGRLPVRLS